RAVEVALVLLRGPGEVELHSIALDRRLEHDLEIPLASLEHVARVPDSVLELAQARAGPALGVVKHLGERLLELVPADSIVQLHHTPNPAPRCCELGTQVRSPL